jgi:hypothetical protein
MFKFTIRELVLLTIIAALGVAWWLDRRSALVNALANEKASKAMAIDAMVKAETTEARLQAALTQLQAAKSELAESEGQRPGIKPDEAGPTPARRDRPVLPRDLQTPEFRRPGAESGDPQ